jgi:hypothetical protein
MIHLSKSVVVSVIQTIFSVLRLCCSPLSAGLLSSVDFPAFLAFSRKGRQRCRGMNLRISHFSVMNT